MYVSNATFSIRPTLPSHCWTTILSFNGIIKTCMLCITNWLLILGSCTYNIIRFFYNIVYVILCIGKYSKKGSVVFQRVHGIKKRSLLNLCCVFHPQSLSPSFFSYFHFFSLHFPSIFLFVLIPAYAKHGDSVCSGK